jgi:CheY-like chemotaxis protein
MSTAAQIGGPQRVAIINDDPDDRKIWSLQVEEAGYLPYVIEQPGGIAFGSVQQLIAEVETHASWAVCDHRLSPRGMAQFYGAEAVAALNSRRHTPALLVTTYNKIDVDVSIRRFRRNVPILLSAEEFQDPFVIQSQIFACSQEVLEQKIPPHRVSRKSLIHIYGLDKESGIDVVDAVIPGWNTVTKVRFPLDLIGQDLWEGVRPDTYFTAYVNRGAEKEEDLFLERFEAAPEVDPTDGLS